MSNQPEMDDGMSNQPETGNNMSTPHNKTEKPDHWWDDWEDDIRDDVRELFNGSTSMLIAVSFKQNTSQQEPNQSDDKWDMSTPHNDTGKSHS
jgi:hypothetical protein